MELSHQIRKKQHKAQSCRVRACVSALKSMLSGQDAEGTYRTYIGAGALPPDGFTNPADPRVQEELTDGLGSGGSWKQFDACNSTPISRRSCEICLRGLARLCCIRSQRLDCLE